VLLGFLLGAAAAIAALLHADFRPARPAEPAALTLSAPIHAPPPSATPAVQPAKPKPAASAKTDAKAEAPAKPKPPAPPSEEVQITEDAAAAGMTSHKQSDAPDLY
jgi:hypothetical protein